ncbi:hypothetical protein [Chamaesiphon sp. OTE_20_metabat_361]|uniref:hypothetical protein n=1 Tax=Chamaesiphon sp. OTE_20_metabat_361 TaxID=2964689 RepID=UPI00286C091F|nr:hypothetical protein [Chamaesiphon sp. OTE_20_metabat_361]
MPERAINTRSATGCLLLLIPAALTISALFVAWPIILGVTLAIAGGNIWQSYEWTKTARSIDPVFQQLIVQNRGEISALDLSLQANVSGKVSDRYLVAKASEFGTGRRQHPDRGQVYYFVSVSTLGQIFDDSEREPPALMPATTPVATFPQTVAPEAVPELAYSEYRVAHTANSAMSFAPEATLSAAPATVTDLEQAIPAIDVSASESTPSIEQMPVPSAESTELADLPSVLSSDSPELAHKTSGETSLSMEIESAPFVAVEQTVTSQQPQVLIIQSELAKRLDVHSSTIYKRRSEPNFTDWTRNRDPEGLAWGYSEANKEYYRVET